ncbi:cupin domain-containing protein [Micromonospora sp. CA-259024]|uniref:cupin domain-containing protein n=1 Tax=Micromonospora sp. CA-259024 TaxID=3239965 RepID=UPI003D94C600
MTSDRMTKIAAADVLPNRRRGGDLRTLLSPATAGTTSGFMGVLTLAPGEVVTEHYHPYSEEFLYLVSGAITARIDGERVPLAAGEALHLQPNVRHRLENTADTEAFLVFQLGPLAPRPELGHVDTEQLPDQAGT